MLSGKMIKIDKELIKELNENYENRLTSAQNIRLKEHFLQIRAECINTGCCRVK